MSYICHQILLTETVSPDNTQADRPNVCDIAGTISLEPAQSLSAVRQAWQLVYRQYVRAGLIEANPWHVHTVPQALGPKVLVLRMLLGEQLAGTLTVMADGSHGLPLDSVYAEELGILRDQARQLVEIGLFAEDSTLASASARLDLMRWAFYGGVFFGATDLIIGVHPHHARFYQRLIGFEPLACVRAYPTVNFHPVMPLRLDMAASLQRQIQPRVLQYFVTYPLEKDAFANHYRFPPDDLIGSDIRDFLPMRISRQTQPAIRNPDCASGPPCTATARHIPTLPADPSGRTLPGPVC